MRLISRSNWLGYPGAVIADELMQFFGLGVLPLIAIPMAWPCASSVTVASAAPFAHRLWLAATIAASGALSRLPVTSGWALAAAWR
jgi:S-DNA-T family DNA segregation ATPase FtsK/SpoIIIE